eukprot:UN16730
MVGFVHNVPEKWGLGKKQLRQFQVQLVEIQRVVMSKTMYNTCISQAFAHQPAKPESAQKIVGTNQALYQEMDRYIRSQVKTIYEEMRTQESEPRKRLVDVYCLYGLFRKIT